MTHPQKILQSVTDRSDLTERERDEAREAMYFAVLELLMEILPESNPPPKGDLKRSVDLASGPECWRWAGDLKPNGYGMYWLVDRKRYAHRVAYELVKGPIPDGLQIDHLCRNRRCVNPDHLEAVSQRENLLRGTGPSALHAAQTHCIHGHEFTPQNTYVRKNGARQCRACGRILDQKRVGRR